MSFEDMMKELQVEYINNLANKITAIETYFQNKDLPALQNEFHKIKGTGKTYGIPELSKLARVIEQACKDNHNVDQIVPVAIDVLKKIEVARKNGTAFDIDTEDGFSEINSLAA